MSKIKNISTLNEALPMLRELENECGEDMPIYNVITERQGRSAVSDRRGQYPPQILKSFYFPTGFLACGEEK